MAYYAKPFVIEEDEKTIKILSDRGFGKVENERMVLSGVEALYLLENKRITVEKDGKKISFHALLKELSKIDKEVYNKYIVYKDLRSKGYIIRSGFKFGTYLRVYEKGIRPGEGKSDYLVYIFSAGEKIETEKIQILTKTAQLTKKNLIIAVADEEDVKYYKLNRIQM
jgi:tRNA-intron endonuclease